MSIAEQAPCTTNIEQIIRKHILASLISIIVSSMLVKLFECTLG